MHLRHTEDDYFSKEECQFFLELAKKAAVQDDGYNEERKSPKNKFETFSGLSLSRAAFLVAQNLLEVEFLHNFVALSKKVLEHTKKHFNQEELYFSFTHLVCRAAIPGQESDEHMSHDIHADNCIPFSNGTCSRELPAFSWRDFSAIVYLNEDFEGGELVFAEDLDGKNIEEKIKPKCGRIVTFSSGPENLHGVLGITEGSRCALGLWFTKQKEHQEPERILAIETISQLRRDGKVDTALMNHLESMLD